MKDTLMVYYSLNGNSAFAAEELMKHIDMDVERLKVRNEPKTRGFGKFLKGGAAALRGSDPGLWTVAADPQEYYEIVIAFPVWAGTYPPAIGAFLKQKPFRGKSVYLIGCSASGNAEGAFGKLTDALQGNTVLGTLSLKNPLKNKEEAAEEIRVFAARRH